jgi:hypothetical protein
LFYFAQSIDAVARRNELFNGFVHESVHGSLSFHQDGYAMMDGRQ